jgi:3-hydroxyacyl-[acyl-carrier-protein] dehydratase
MLLNNFFFIDDLTQDESSIQAQIHIDVEHPILKGHFPAQPVVPGVCIIEMLKEILQESEHKTYQLLSASAVKFLTPFAPPHFLSASFQIKKSLTVDGNLQVNATLLFEAITFMKFQGVFLEIKTHP